LIIDAQIDTAILRDTTSGRRRPWPVERPSCRRRGVGVFGGGRAGKVSNLVPGSQFLLTACDAQLVGLRCADSAAYFSPSGISAMQNGQ
jgi:hypothetical protein